MGHDTTSATTSPEKPRSRLLNLPAELRLEIYRHAMVDFYRDAGKDGHWIILQIAEPLLCLSKLIRKEAMPVYFDCLDIMCLAVSDELHAIEQLFQAALDAEESERFNPLGEMIVEWEEMTGEVAFALEWMKSEALLQ